jgi:ketosteroid isomerase-like protein
MSTTATDAGQIAEGYAKALTSGDSAAMARFLARDVVCDAPGGRIEGAEAYRQFTQQFVDLVDSATITKILVDETSAAIVYSFDTPWMKDFRAADYVTIEDGTIRHITSIFDRLPGAEAARNAQG